MCHIYTSFIVYILLLNLDILKNHRIGRVLSTADSNGSDEKTIKNIHDVLGPLPAIPTTNDEYSRWSIRRASGYSGIYEEILDSNDVR